MLGQLQGDVFSDSERQAERPFAGLRQALVNRLTLAELLLQILRLSPSSELLRGRRLPGLPPKQTLNPRGELHLEVSLQTRDGFNTVHDAPEHWPNAVRFHSE